MARQRMTAGERRGLIVLVIVLAAIVGAAILTRPKAVTPDVATVIVDTATEDEPSVEKDERSGVHGAKKEKAPRASKSSAKKKKGDGERKSAPKPKSSPKSAPTRSPLDEPV